jgi:hypothetical protein
MTEAEAAAEAKKTVRTLRLWRKRGIGPPYTYFGRTPKYRRRAFFEHFRQAEIVPVRERKSRPRQEAGRVR